MIQSFFTKEPHWLERWDLFLQQTERGLYNQLSDWIRAYEVYGFDYELFILTENDTIVGGCGIVIAKFSFFKFYTVPCGPVLVQEHENQIDFILTELKKNAKAKGCCYFQITLPIVAGTQPKLDYTLSADLQSKAYVTGNEGTKFKYVIPLYGMRLIDLEGKTITEILSKFSGNHKRNIKKAQAEGIRFELVSEPTMVEEAYQCIVNNANEKGFAVRSFESIKGTLFTYLEKDFAQIGVCLYQNQIISAIYTIKCGNRLIYISGGVVKEYQHLSPSHFMHYSMLNYSIEKNYKTYDISVGGSEGVIRFKEGFGSELFEFVPTKHWILKPMTFKLYELLASKLKSHKAKIAALLFKLKKFKS